MKSKIGKQSISSGSRKVSFTPIEDMLNLATMVHINLRGRKLGAYLLMKGKNSFSFVFGFDCQGIHSTLRQDQVEALFDQVESGLKDLPPGESITFHLASFSSDEVRQQQLAELVERSGSEDLQFLLMGERARVQELTRNGIRKPKRLRLYVTYTMDGGAEGAQDWLEKLIARGERLWHSFKGELADMERKRIDNLLNKAFTDGFLLWEQVLANKMGLEVRPMGEEELWAALWQRFNNTKPRPIPQLLRLNEEGLKEEIHTDIHSTTMLLESVPVADNAWVQVQDNYVGVLTFLEKPAGWADKMGQLRYLWEVFARETVVDTEIFCQLTRANETVVKTAVQRVLKQSNVSAQVAQEKRSIDVAAQVKTRKSVAAQEQLYEGALPLYTGVAILVHRPTLEQVDEACRYLESCFRKPAWVARERDYAWKIWLQTLPIVWEKLLASPFNRRQIYLSGEVPGLMPLLCTRTGDRQGFELIAEEGGSPVHLDLFTQHKNLALFATTRAGKSVLVSGILTQALAYGMPVVALDFPKPDGTSTFTDYTQFIGGAYFDISREYNNLFEKPDLRTLSPEQQQERFMDYQSFLESALLTMVVGSAGSEDRLLAQTVRSILSLALERFFADLQIQERYDRALAGGWRSEAWQEMPTLHDFFPMCSAESLELGEVEGDIDQALQMIALRIKFWLSSRVGRAISKPSSFPTDAQLLVFALRNLSSEEDAAVLALSAYSAALRRALSSPASIFFIDEAPILFEFSEISSLVGRLCANGAKAGVRVILSAQDPDTVYKSVAASKIIQNLSTRLVGRIQPTALDSFERILKYPRDIITRNATEAFFPKKEGIYSQWLLDDNGAYTYCRYYPAYVQLAAVANNPNEQSARTEAMRQSEDKYEGIARFSRELVSSIRGG
ncbi:hypothetical protein [Anthocerotibacter panamensis]|uniref:hypothetical protein n=1 Tax=Anthocerotibacter panamensis TaxID=2857077 RepID=UPI001C40537A|nr:hypothetical protein [Anthocerotibacter panamensis]